jgi:hypothetical protein
VGYGSFSGPASVARRDPNGGWAIEHLGIVGEPKVIVAAGTVHVLARGVYARRVGTTWESYDVLPGATDGDLAVDDCGTPHLVHSYLYDYTNYLWHVIYTRWTSQGFRSATVYYATCEPPNPAIALGTQHAFIGAYHCGDSGIQSVPLK